MKVTGQISSCFDNAVILLNCRHLINYVQATKTRIKLNPRKLYMADGYSVQEMLKVVSMLYNAVKSNKSDHANEDVTEGSFDVSNKVN